MWRADESEKMQATHPVMEWVASGSNEKAGSDLEAVHQRLQAFGLHRELGGGL